MSKRMKLNNETYVKAPENPNEDFMTELSHIKPERIKRNYFDVLQQMTSNDGHKYGRRCLGTLHDGKMGQFWLKQNDYVISDHTSTKHSCYCTVNTFKRGGSLMKNKKTGGEYYWYHHSKDLVTGLCGLYADLDAKNIGLEYGAQLKPFYKNILELSGLPIPSFVILSGHGLHLLWLFPKEVVIHNNNILPMWQKVENLFVHRLSDASIKYIKHNYKYSYFLNTAKTRAGYYNLVDGHVCDPSRYLRVPGSYNCKNPKNRLLVQTLEDNYKTYPLMGHHSGLYYWSQTRFPYDWNNLTKNNFYRSESKNHLNPKDEKVPSVNDNSQDYTQRLGRIGYLLIDRLHDYKELILLRNQYMNTGYRNELIFQSAVAMTHLGYSKSTMLKKALSMNQLFNDPLPESEVEMCCRTKDYSDFTDLRKYIYSNQYIMSAKHLNITPDEQKHLITLTGDKERQRRAQIAKSKSKQRVHKWREKNGLMGNLTSARLRRFSKQSKARVMYFTHHLAKTTIARKLNESRRTIIRWIHTLSFNNTDTALL